MRASSFTTFAVAAGLVSAQNISPACTDQLTGILNSPDAACLNPAPLLSLFVSVGSTPPSIPDTINNWLNGLLMPRLRPVVANVTSGCAGDLDGSTTESVTKLVQQIYPLARQAMCLKDTSTNVLCVTQSLKSLEDIVGTLTPTDLNAGTLITDFQKVVQGAANLACTNCVKAAGSLVSQQFPEAAQGINALCGAGFIAGGSADQNGVAQTASSEAFVAKKQGGALASSTSKMAAVVAVVLFSGFTLLG
ncbi:hypothetical protein C8J57DRAFT_1284869 [Mycena rebaudengoi]|nr:hypothetical protein C8J57DRAFT_1284869 [Mycena rebaudengoi]